MTGGETSRNAMVNQNHATMFFTVSPKPDIDDTTASSAYARASAYLAELPAVAAARPGYRLFWVRGDEAGHRDIGADDQAVVGRHSACDVALTAASELSLRHLLVATTTLASGALGLRVLDLRASLPFYTDDGEPRRSIVATGPVVLRLGTYLFGGVPIGPDVPRALLPTEMTKAIVTHSVPPAPLEGARGPVTTPSEQSTIVGEDGLLVLDVAAPKNVDPTPAAGTVPPAALLSPLLSRVTVVPATSLLTEVGRPDPEGEASTSKPARSDAPPAFARLTLLREGHSSSLDLPAADLEAGVLIGRSERCTDGGLRRVLDGNISRIHVLLLREGDDVIAFDLCSTQGTFVGGESVRRHRISRAGSVLSLAKTNPVMLYLLPRAGEPEAESPAPTHP